MIDAPPPAPAPAPPAPRVPLRTRMVDAAWRAALPVAWRLARLSWRLRRPAHRGALVAVLVDGRLLVVRQSYRPEWTLPGGGIEPGEDPAAAAARELGEELGLRDPGVALVRVHTETGLWDHRRDTVAFFELRLDRRPPLRLDRREIVGAEWIDPARPPPATTGPLAAYLAWRAAPADDAADDAADAPAPFEA